MDAQLRFEVTDQELKRVDGFLPVMGSRNYLRAKFIFNTPPWVAEETTAVFANQYGAYAEVPLDENGECLIPNDIIADRCILEISLMYGNRVTSGIVSIYVRKTIPSPT